MNKRKWAAGRFKWTERDGWEIGEEQNGWLHAWKADGSGERFDHIPLVGGYYTLLHGSNFIVDGLLNIRPDSTAHYAGVYGPAILDGLAIFGLPLVTIATDCQVGDSTKEGN